MLIIIDFLLVIVDRGLRFNSLIFNPRMNFRINAPSIKICLHFFFIKVSVSDCLLFSTVRLFDPIYVFAN